MNKPVQLALAKIERDLLLQPRAELHRDWIEDYAADMLAGAQMPPIIVYRDKDGKHWLADGFHRVYAAESAGLAKILADVRSGTRRDALMHSLSANAEHGHRRSNDDKRRAVDIMLADREWARWSDHEIARQIGVSQPFVSGRRVSNNDYKIAPPRLVTRGGTTYEMDTSQIGVVTEAAALADTATDRSTVVPFDWAASGVRRDAMDAIRALSKLPIPDEVIAAWMKNDSYGEPYETLDAALAWLAAFVPLYRKHEPIRWERVQRMNERKIDNAAA